jgi:hypothetical protein
MDPFQTSEAAQLFLLRTLYEHFRTNSTWPLAREFDLKYGDLFDPVGGIELVSRQAGASKVTPASPSNNASDKLRVQLAGLVDVEEAQADIQGFLEAVRLAARKYRNSLGKEDTLQLSEVAALPGLDENRAKRVLEIFGSAPVVSGGGGGGQWGVRHEIRRFADVRNIDDFFKMVGDVAARDRAVAEHPAGAFRPVGERSQSTHQPKRIFLSHASDDGALALHLANVLRQDPGNLKVFVASRAGDIPPGADWLDVIESELRVADTYVLLLTPRSVKRFWLAFESGAAWMSQRTFIPLTAAGLGKGEVPFPLGARQALSLEDRADVEEFTKGLNITIDDTDTFCATVRELSRALPKVQANRFAGVEVGGRYYDWEGPFHDLAERDPVPASDELQLALREVGAELAFCTHDRLRDMLAAGWVRLHQTDHATWRRDILLPGHGDQFLVVRAPRSGES